MVSEADTCRKLMTPKLVHELDTEGKQLRVIKLTDYTEKVRTLVPAPTNSVRAGPMAADARRSSNQLAEREIDFQQLASQAPSRSTCTIIWPSTHPCSRGEFFNNLAPDARIILNELLEKCATNGELQFTLPDVLKIPPISHHGNVNEIVNKFRSGRAPQRRCRVVK
jgi:type I restriction enzyme, R subunit